MILVVWAVLRRRLQRWLYTVCDDRLGWATGSRWCWPRHILFMWSLCFLLCLFMLELRRAASSVREMRA